MWQYYKYYFVKSKKNKFIGLIFKVFKCLMTKLHSVFHIGYLISIDSTYKMTDNLKISKFYEFYDLKVPRSLIFRKHDNYYEL
jgi:hypothetical protein